MPSLDYKVWNSPRLSFFSIYAYTSPTQPKRDWSSEEQRNTPQMNNSIGKNKLLDKIRSHPGLFLVLLLQFVYARPYLKYLQNNNNFKKRE